MLHDAWQPNSVVAWVPDTHEPPGAAVHSAALVQGTSTVSPLTNAVHGVGLPKHVPPTVGVQLLCWVEVPAQLRHPARQHPCSSDWTPLVARSGYRPSHVDLQMVAP